MRTVNYLDIKPGHRIAGLTISSCVRLSRCMCVTFEDGTEECYSGDINIDEHEPPRFKIVDFNAPVESVDPWAIHDPNAQRGGLYGADKFFNTGGR